MTDAEAKRRSSSGLGVAALLGALVPAVWVLVLLAVASSTGVGLDELATTMIVLTAIVLPLVAIVVVVLAVSALISNNTLGRVLGAVALVLLVAQGVLGADLLGVLAA